MKKWRLRKIKFNKVDLNEIDDRTLLLNLYFTQALTLVLGFVFILFQRQSLITLFNYSSIAQYMIWGTCFALLVVGVDLLVSRWVPDDVTDDGGVNERLFGKRPVWHIAVISLVVAICEELLFRGAIQWLCGPYWTSIIFAVIHVRYLRSWIMTGLIFSISYGLGWIYEETGSLLTPIIAHFWIDFIMGCILRFQKK